MTFRRSRSLKLGLPPGSTVFTGERRREAVTIEAITWDAGFCDRRVAAVEECAGIATTHPGVTWINVDSVHDTDVLTRLGEEFGLHPLTVEDLASTEQRAKVEDYGDYLYIVARMLRLDESDGRIVHEQVSLVLKDRLLLSFQEGIRGDVFDAVRERLAAGKGRIRTLGADYLCYALIDAIVDHYFLILERLGERLERTEDHLLRHPAELVLTDLHALRRELITLRKAVWPLREVIGWMLRDDTPLVSDSTDVFLRDVYDHSIQVIDAIETNRDLVSGMADMYMSSVSNRMNEIMKVLTIIATIFIPLTFIAGVYGMNFAYMPELEWRFGYPFIWLVMLAVGAGMLWYFRRRRWI